MSSSLTTSVADEVARFAISALVRIVSSARLVQGQPNEPPAKEGQEAVGLFSPYKQDKQPDETVDTQPSAKVAVARKNRPTPTRKEAEAARMAQLHPKLTRRQARAADQVAEREQQVKQREAVESRPEQVLMRNYVDTRWSLLSLMLVLLFLLIVSMFTANLIPQFAIGVTAFLYVYLVACIINFIIVWQGFKRELARRHPNASSSGLWFPMMSRMMSPMRLRVPQPVVKRGDSY